MVYGLSLRHQFQIDIVGDGVGWGKRGPEPLSTGNMIITVLKIKKLVSENSSCCRRASKSWRQDSNPLLSCCKASAPRQYSDYPCPFPHSPQAPCPGPTHALPFSQPSMVFSPDPSTIEELSCQPADHHHEVKRHGVQQTGPRAPPVASPFIAASSGLPPFPAHSRTPSCAGRKNPLVLPALPPEERQEESSSTFLQRQREMMADAQD